MNPPTTPELAFEFIDAVPERSAATPTLNLEIGVERLDDGPVHCVMLTTTATIAAARRAYGHTDQERLISLFGPPEQWGRSLRGVTWAKVTTTVPAFTGRTIIALPIACGYDLQLAAAQYLHALTDGDVPIELTFSGTVFYPDHDGALRTGQIPWRHEADGRFPVRTWRELIDRYYGATRWLRLEEEHFDRLASYKARHAYASFDDAIDVLLRAAEESERT